MENENTNEKKKQKITILVGVVTLLIAVLGATYAYFQISTDTDSSNTTITGKTPPKSLVTLKGITSNLHINLSASDMSYENRTKEYYGTDGEESYVGIEELGTKTIASVELTGGEATTKYSCTAKLTVSKVTEPAEDKDTMIEVLQPDDMILQFKGDIISEKLDLSELKSTGSKEYDLSFKITGNATKDIQAYIKLINKNTPQNYLAGKKLNIDISTSELKCDIAGPKTIDKLRNNDPKNKLSSEIVGGMYRYQGTSSDEINNYICFGTNDKSKCACNDDGTCDDTKLDKYMYRIIGITEEGQLYLIKMKGVEEGEEGDTTTFQWNSNYTENQCTGNKCVWPNSDIYKRLNGTSSNGNPIFINNPRYEYMKEKNVWYENIEKHNWKFGDVENNAPSWDMDGITVYSINNNGLIVYDIETGVKAAYGYYPSYYWTSSIDAKIGLMYLHDYALAYNNTTITYYIPDSVWLNSKNNKGPTNKSDWSITRRGFMRDASSYSLFVYAFGDSSSLYNPRSNDEGIARPTFYLNSTVKIKSGTGSISDPYILDVQE